MKNNLSLAGSEIINESRTKYNNSNILNTTPIKTEQKQKIITKSYKISDENTQDKNSISNKNKESYTAKRESLTTKKYSLDLSKIKYNDGYILTDAVNSNPGYGLWALKLQKKDKDNHNKKILENITTKRKSIKNITTINSNITNNSNINKITITTNNISNNKIIDKSLDLSINSKNNEIKKRNKLLIEDLKMRCNDLESKCTNLVSNLDQKIFMCNNSIKLKNEYESLLQQNTKDIKLINEKCSTLSLENSKMDNVYKNMENEVNRLLNVMKTDKENMEKIKEEFKTRLKEEENERQRLNNILKDVTEKLKFLEEENEEKTKEKNIENLNNNLNINIEIVNKEDSEAKKEFEDENLNDVILELELKICDMKKKINKQEEENEKLKKIIRFKEEKNGIEKYKLKNLNYLLQFQKENQKNDLYIVSQKNSLISELRKKVHIKSKSNNKMINSFSLRKVYK